MLSFPKQDITNIKVGDILISEPMLPDGNFSRTVILICDDTADSHLGFVLNKPYEKQNVEDLLGDFEGVNRQVFIGGPVQQEIIQVLHKCATVEDAIPLGDGIFWGGNFDQIRSQLLVYGDNQDDFWFYVGYSGWQPGQLKKELIENSWLVLRHDLQTILSIPVEDLWKKSIRYLGKEFEILTKFPVDPNLN